jgi:hypothetical protein
MNAELVGGILHRLNRRLGLGPKRSIFMCRANSLQAILGKIGVVDGRVEEKQK